VDVVPRVVVSGGGAEGGATSSSIMEGLLTLLLSDKLGVSVSSDQPRERDPAADRLRSEIRQSLTESRRAAPPAPTAAA
jgi:hypothetical protein